MAKYKVTLTARFGKDRPSVTAVVEAPTIKDAHRYVMKAIAPGAKIEIEERGTLRATQ